MLNLQVTDITEHGIKFRGLASTKNPGDSWNLKCEVLERLNAFIVANYPASLPKFRVITHEV
jgi:hypothetical protein